MVYMTDAENPQRIVDEEEFDEFVSAMISDADPILVFDAFPDYAKHAFDFDPFIASLNAPDDED